MPVIATAGHVDHGKSALVEALTGTHPDRLAEERRRGLTLDLGFAWTDLDGERFAFVDVPGHQRYVETMLAGVGGGLPVMFVVAADEGWRAQSAEHAHLLAALGCPSVLLVVSRCDLADPGSGLQEAQSRLTEVGLPPYAAVPVSAVTGAGMSELRSTLVAWAGTLPPARTEDPVRLWVDRRFSVAGAGTVVTGTLTQGTLRVGDRVEVAGRVATIRGLHRNDEAALVVRAESRVAIALRGLPREAVARGDLLTPPGEGAAARSATLAVPADAHPLPRQATAHLGTASFPVMLHSRADGLVRLRVRNERTAPLRTGDRLLLRDPGNHEVLTVGDVLTVDSAQLPRDVGRARPVTDRPPPESHPRGLDHLASWFDDHPRDAPTSAQLAGWGLGARALAEAEARGEVLRVGGLVLRPRLLVETAAALADLDAPFGAGDACRVIGVPRRIGIPLLERLDATQVTRRHRDGTRSLRR